MNVYICMYICILTFDLSENPLMSEPFHKGECSLRTHHGLGMTENQTNVMIKLYIYINLVARNNDW